MPFLVLSMLIIVGIVAVFVAYLPAVRNANRHNQFITERPVPPNGAQTPRPETPAEIVLQEEPVPARQYAEQPQVVPPVEVPQVVVPPEVAPPVGGEPVAQPPVEQPQAAPPAQQPQTREQGVFFVRVENEGADLLLTRVSRTFSVSNTPLLDSLNALLAGPTAEEAARGMVSFIPPAARILSVRVEGHALGIAGQDTAYINFNEYFQYNIGGSEGLMSQIKQIVWTATEFPNVNDVQILIEGNRIDFLHGGIRIGSPIGR